MKGGSEAAKVNRRISADDFAILSTARSTATALSSAIGTARKVQLDPISKECADEAIMRRPGNLWNE